MRLALCSFDMDGVDGVATGGVGGVGGGVQHLPLSALTLPNSVISTSWLANLNNPQLINQKNESRWNESTWRSFAFLAPGGR